VPFCTVVEFEWEGAAGRSAFEAAMSAVAAEAPPPAGRLCRIVGLEETGAHVIEVWNSPAEAQRFADAAGPLLARVSFPAPSTVGGFEVTTFETS
jgi:hypothetical protein